MNFNLTSPYSPTGDQPEAIELLLKSLQKNNKYQTLLGVTGSGKTFTIANVIANLNRPVLVLSHNKTLAAQLYGEFKSFFPDNLVEYFVSYYDYYQPEAYLPTTDTYIEKDLSINEEIEKLRLSATSALLSGRHDVIVVASVSCIYGIGNPDDFHNNSLNVKKGDKISRNTLLYSLVDALYARTETDFKHGTFRVRGDTVDIFLAYSDFAYRITFWGDEIEEISSFEPSTGKALQEHDEVKIYPANIFVTSRFRINEAIKQIQDDTVIRSQELKEQGKVLEAKRLEERVTFDLEMIKELGYCSGIENYSRYFDGRKPGSRPFCLLDYFPKDFIAVIDESHVTIPQVRGMHGGDKSRKTTLVEYGFRLPAAMDNRPLSFDEFETMLGQIIYVSATPADFEIERSGGVVVEQLIRPTGIMDPKIDVRPSLNQIDDLLNEVRIRVERNERVLITTITKRLAEELSKFMLNLNIKCTYIHSDVDTLERVEIMDGLRNGFFDVLVGVNLLREGLDLPEVSLVAILDADKEGFLRNARSLTQTAGRAARHINGQVIMYADRITRSMQQTIDDTNRKRIKQQQYNIENDITPTQIKRESFSLAGKMKKGEEKKKYRPYIEETEEKMVADPVTSYMNEEQIIKAIDNAKKNMEREAKTLNFIEAAMYRDEMRNLEKLLNEKKSQKK
jgi:excinuclease ABC subunit B